jgi:hypothetical protein
LFRRPLFDTDWYSVFFVTYVANICVAVIYTFTCIFDCKANPLVNKIHQLWPIPIHGGLPDVTQDLRWCDGQTTPPNLFIVGAMAGLQVGPDAGNLMGIRRAALVIADSLDCRCWLREKALVNPFEALLLSDSDSDTESEDESEEDLPTCCDEDLESECACIDDQFKLPGIQLVQHNVKKLSS